MSSGFMELDDGAFRRIRGVMQDAIGLSLSDAKKPLVSSRLLARLRELGLRSYADYARRLEDGEEPAELQVAVDLLTTNETYFFREQHHFDFLEQHWRSRRSLTPINVWSAASSFGDEAYSVAMLLSDLQQRGQVHPGWSVLATDISHRVLTAAKAGIYPQDRLRNVDSERLRRYCLRGEGEYAGQTLIHPKLRERVRFGQLNLCQSLPSLGPFDVAFLRNVLIYFDPATKAQVINRVVSCLKPGGLLILGTAEGRPLGRDDFHHEAPGVFRQIHP